jgi:hypothetical protein
MIKAAFVLIGQAEICSFIVPSFCLETADRAVAVVAPINLRGPVELLWWVRQASHLPPFARLERSRHCILLSCCYGSGTRPSATPGRTAWTCAPLFFRVSCVGNKWSVLVNDLQTAKYMSEYQKFHTDCRNANLKVDHTEREISRQKQLLAIGTIFCRASRSLRLFSSCRMIMISAVVRTSLVSSQID